MGGLLTFNQLSVQHVTPMFPDNMSGVFYLIFDEKWLADGDSLMCCILTMGRQISEIRTRAINGQWKLMGINNHVLILMGINGD